MTHTVTLRLRATVEIPDAESLDEALSSAQDLLGDVTITMRALSGPRLVHFDLDADSTVGAAGEDDDEDVPREP